MKKLIKAALFGVLLACPFVKAHSLALPQVSITTGTLQAGTTWGFYVSSGTALKMSIGTGTITNLSVTSSTMTRLNVTSGTISNFTSYSSSGTLFSFSSGTVRSFTATSASSTFANISSGTIVSFTAASASSTLANISSGTINAFTAQSATAAVVGITSGTITSLTVFSSTGSTMNFSSGTITQFTATASSMTRLNVNIISTASTNSGVAIKGTGINDDASAGFVGEYQGLSKTNVNVAATGTYFVVSTMTLTPGDYNLTGMVSWDRNGATFTAIDVETCITATAGNNFTGCNTFTSTSYAPATINAPTSFSSLSLSLPVVRVSITATTDYYLKAYTATYSAGSPLVNTGFSSRRVR